MSPSAGPEEEGTPSVGGYPVPACQVRVEEVIRRSRFITTLARVRTVDEARTFVDRIGKEFPDATHNCWAFAAGPPGDTATIGSSDDGEPGGTAGRPMLKVLAHGGVGEVGAVVTRYYGGTKLGTGGLARAYSGGVKAALEALPTTLEVSRVSVRLDVQYAYADAVKRMLPEFQVLVRREEFTDLVRIGCEVPEVRFEAFRAAYGDCTRGSGTIEPA